MDRLKLSSTMYVELGRFPANLSETNRQTPLLRFVLLPDLSIHLSHLLTTSRRPLLGPPGPVLAVKFRLAGQRSQGGGPPSGSFVDVLCVLEAHLLQPGVLLVP